MVFFLYVINRYKYDFCNSNDAFQKQVMYHTDLLATKYVNNSSIIVLAISLFILYNPTSLFDTFKQMLEKRSRFDRGNFKEEF